MTKKTNKNIFGVVAKHKVTKHIDDYDFDQDIKKVRTKAKKKTTANKMVHNKVTTITVESSFEQLYKYQQEAVMEVLKRLKELKFFNGKIILPTGAGKTKIMEHLIGMIKFYNKLNHICFATFCHRLILSNELLERHIRACVEFGIKKLTVYVVSSNEPKSLIARIKDPKGKYNYNIEYYDHSELVDEYKDGADSEVTIRFRKFNDYTEGRVFDKTNITDEFEEGYSVMFAVLYHSMDKLEEQDIHFDFAFYDESHTTTRYKWFNTLKNIIKLSDINLFFTATPSNDKDGEFDMNNEKVYGETLIFREPWQLVYSKHITPFKNVFIDLYNDNDEKIEYDDSKKKNNMLNSIKAIFKKHKKHIKHDSHGKENASLFCAFPGNEYIKEFLTPETRIGRNFKSFRINNRVNVYIISSKFGGNILYWRKEMKDKKDLNKEDFLTQLNEDMKNLHDDVIIIHIDMLTEGIDLPNINGMIYFKGGCDPAKLIQFLGRGLRRILEDRGLIDDPNVAWDDEEKFRKPCAYNYIPVCTGDATEIAMITDYINRMVSAYGEMVFNSFYHEPIIGDDDDEGDDNPDMNQIKTDETALPKDRTKKCVENIVTLFKAKNNEDEKKEIIKDFLNYAWKETKDMTKVNEWKEFGNKLGIDKFIEFIKANNYL